MPATHPCVPQHLPPITHSDTLSNTKSTTHQANRQLRELREIAKGVTKQLPDVIQNATAKIDEYARGMISGTGSTLFEELGFYYIGPVDGHNMQDLVDVLSGGFEDGLKGRKGQSRKGSVSTQCCAVWCDGGKAVGGWAL